MSALTMKEFSRMMESEERSSLLEALREITDMDKAEDLAEIKAMVLATWEAGAGSPASQARPSGLTAVFRVAGHSQGWGPATWFSDKLARRRFPFARGLGKTEHGDGD